MGVVSMATWPGLWATLGGESLCFFGFSRGIGFHDVDSIRGWQGEGDGNFGGVLFEGKGVGKSVGFGAVTLEFHEGDQALANGSDLFGNFVITSGELEGGVDGFLGFADLKAHGFGEANDSGVGIGVAHFEVLGGGLEERGGVIQRRESLAGAEIAGGEVHDIQSFGDGGLALAEDENAGGLGGGIGAGFGAVFAFVRIINPAMDKMLIVIGALIIVGAFREGGQMFGIEIGVNEDDGFVRSFGQPIKGDAVKLGAEVEFEHGLKGGELGLGFRFFEFTDDELADGGVAESIKVHVDEPHGVGGNIGPLERNRVGETGSGQQRKGEENKFSSA